MIYKREITCGVIGRISTVDSDTGEYITETWISGTLTSRVKLNIYAMGWNSADEFLKQRKGFVRVNDNNS